jgi:hypothetical protein
MVQTELVTLKGLDDLRRQAARQDAPLDVPQMVNSEVVQRQALETRHSPC